MADKITLVQVRDGLQKLFNAGPNTACAAFPLAQWINGIDAHIAAMGEPVAWLRNGASALRPDPHVITSVVRDLWMKADPSRVERYTIPLYRAPPAPEGDTTELFAGTHAELSALSINSKDKQS